MQEKLKNLRKLAEEQIKSAGNMEEVEKLRHSKNVLKKIIEETGI